MKTESRQQSNERTKPRYLVLTLVILVLCMLLAGILFTLNRNRIKSANSIESRAASGYTLQDPNEAENYRRLAAAKRKAAERVPEKRNCYEAWAKYYDCLADRAEFGDGRQCPATPEC